MSIAASDHSPSRSLYSHHLVGDDLIMFEIARSVDGVDDEIAVVRLNLSRIQADNPHDYRTQNEITKILDRLIRTRKDVFGLEDDAPPEKPQILPPQLSTAAVFEKPGCSPPPQTEDIQANDSHRTGASDLASIQLLPPTPQPTLSRPSSAFGRVPAFSHGVSRRSARLKARKKHSRHR